MSAAFASPVSSTTATVSSRPVIGLLLDWQEKGTFSQRPHYALRQSYFDAVWQAGGLPMALPLVPEQTLAALNLVHGVLVPGGDYPSPSAWYADPHGIESTHPRAQNSIALLQEIVRRDLPLLAICAGMQELAVAMGGKLHWRVAQQVAATGGTPAPHRSIDADKVAHSIEIVENTQLARVLGGLQAEVNSAHNEGVAETGRAIVSATAPDGVIEAIEVPGNRFAIGVEWHPEFLLGPLDYALFKGLVEAARGTYQG